jgi:hypothetical protein
LAAYVIKIFRSILDSLQMFNKGSVRRPPHFLVNLISDHTFVSKAAVNLTAAARGLPAVPANLWAMMEGTQHVYVPP